MAYRHGIYMSEVPTNLLSMVRSSGGVTVAIGTAPVHLATDPAPVGEPVLCRTYNEAVSRLGYSTDTSSYTLCEVIDVVFGLYQVSPVVFINVFDPAKAAHSDSTEKQSKTLDAKKQVTLTGDIIVNTIQVEDTGTNVITAFTVEKTDTGAVLTFADLASGTKVNVSYVEPKPSGVTAADVLGGVDAASGKLTGLELINEVYPRFGLTVGQIIAPGWSNTPEIALKLMSKAQNINGHFSAHAIVDLEGNTADAAKTFKTQKGLSSPFLTVCYPHVRYGDRVHCLSTHLAGLLMKIAIDDNEVPYRSPSNQTVYIEGMCNADGSSNYFGMETANELNGAGIMTVNNFNGWKAWGNNTSAYPGNTDPKDRLLNVRRMFDYVKNTLTVSYWSKIDMPITAPNVNSAVNSANIWLSSLVNQGALLGGRVVFSEDDNNNQSLMDGVLTFHCWITPPSAAEVINFTMEYDPDYQSTIFTEV